jgi:hypothetical protein
MTLILVKSENPLRGTTTHKCNRYQHPIAKT